MNIKELELDERLENEFVEYCSTQECAKCKFYKNNHCRTIYKVLLLLKYIIKLIERGY